MARSTAISWAGGTWNPWYGCTKISPGCADCYMFRWARRTGRDPEIVVRSATTFNDPLKWSDPLDVFTCSLSDFFHPGADAWRDEAWSVIDRTRQHTYLITTKRVDRVAGRLPWQRKADAWAHVIIIASAENQKYFDLREPALYALPVARVGWSLEPLLGPIDMRIEPFAGRACQARPSSAPSVAALVELVQAAGRRFRARLSIPPHWVIAGGLSGGPLQHRLVAYSARAVDGVMQPPSWHPTAAGLTWVTSLRDQCLAAGVPFHFKQWGGPLPTSGGRLLDGAEWNLGPLEIG